MFNKIHKDNLNEFNDYFDQVIEINLSELGPLLNGPFTPDLSTILHDSIIIEILARRVGS